MEDIEAQSWRALEVLQIGGVQRLPVAAGVVGERTGSMGPVEVFTDHCGGRVEQVGDSRAGVVTARSPP